MIGRCSCGLLVLLLSMTVGTAPVPGAPDAEAVHCAVLTVDSHIDVPGVFMTAEVDPGHEGGPQLTLPKMKRGCLDAASSLPQWDRTPAHPSGMRTPGGKPAA